MIFEKNNKMSVRQVLDCMGSDNRFEILISFGFLPNIDFASIQSLSWNLDVVVEIILFLYHDLSCKGGSSGKIALKNLGKAYKEYILTGLDIYSDQVYLCEVMCIQELPEDFLQDEEFFLELLKINSIFLDFVPRSFWQSRGFVKEVVSVDGFALNYAVNFQSDLVIAVIAIMNDPSAVKFVSPELKERHKDFDAMIGIIESLITSVQKRSDSELTREEAFHKALGIIQNNFL